VSTRSLWGRIYDRYARARDRIFSSPGFQRWAATSLLARWITRRRTEALFDVVAGFVYSQVLTAAVRLDVLRVLQSGPHELGLIAERTGLEREATRRLLEACVALRLAERRGKERYGLGVLGSPLLGNPSVEAMVLHHPVFYRDLEDPVALLREERRPTELQRYWSYAREPAPAALPPERVADYTRLMRDTQNMVARDVLDALDLRGARRLVDVGGGDGAFLEAVAVRYPDLELTLFDLPGVVVGASSQFTRVSGDIFNDPIPTADCVTLVRILHDHDDAAVDTILCGVHSALDLGGRVVVAEPMAGREQYPPVAAGYFGLYLWTMGHGRLRSPEELSSALRKAGFSRIRRVPCRRPLLASVLIGDKISQGEP